MSVLRKILDKLGFRREKGQSAILGTTEVAPPDPLSTTTTEASKAASRKKPVPSIKQAGTAPVSKKGKKGNTERLR